MKIDFAASGVCTCGSRECASVGSSSLQVKVGLRSQIHDTMLRLSEGRRKLVFIMPSESNIADG